AAVDQVELGSPNIVRVVSPRWCGPDANARIVADARNRLGAPDVNLSFVAALGIVIVSAVKNHPRIGRMRWQYRIDSFAFVGRLNASDRGAPDWRPIRKRVFS